MSGYTEEELSKYIWKHYEALIDQECDYVAMARAWTFYRYSEQLRAGFIREKDRQYLSWPLEKLKAEVIAFHGDRSKQTALEVARKYAEQIYLNVCPNCGKLPASPQAEYCLHCRASWRWTNPLRRAKNQAKNDD